MAKTRPNPICVPENPELLQLLAQLNVKVTETADHQKVVTEKDCRRAGIPFELFQAFARLTKSEPPIGSSLWTQKDGLSLTPNQRILLESMLLKMLLAEREAPAPAPSDDAIDDREAAQLKRLLKSLDDIAPLIIAPLIQQDRLVNPRQVKVRLVALSSDPCWLAPESIQIGLLGAVTGDLKYYYDIVKDVASPATEFSCSYLPQLRGWQGGLFFRPEKMPASVRQASQSVVRIEPLIDDRVRSFGFPETLGSGSGVVVDDQYVLTAEHVLDNILLKKAVRDGKVFYHLRMTVGGESRDVLAERIDLPRRIDRDSPSADLVVLHVPALPTGVRPIPFAEDFRPVSTEVRRGLDQAKAANSSHNIFLSLLKAHPDLATRIYRTYPSRSVFAIGVPTQPLPYEILVTEGVVDHRHSYDSVRGKDEFDFLSDADNNGRVLTTSIALPGDSGGAVVDEQGRLIGIIVALAHQPDENPLKRKWKGSRGVMEEIHRSCMHSVDQWGEAIRTAIQGHRK